MYFTRRLVSIRVYLTIYLCINKALNKLFTYSSVLISILADVYRQSVKAIHHLINLTNILILKQVLSIFTIYI